MDGYYNGFQGNIDSSSMDDVPICGKKFLVGVWEETFFRGYLFTTIYNGLRLQVIPGKHRILIAL